MSAKLQRKGRLPDKHLLQIRIYRDRDPDIYEFLEAIEIGEISATMKEIIRNGIGLVSGVKRRKPQAADRATSPQPRQAFATSIAPSHHERDQEPPPSEEVAPPKPQREQQPSVVPSSAPMDPDLMRLLAEEDASS